MSINNYIKVWLLHKNWKHISSLFLSGWICSKLSQIPEALKGIDYYLVNLVNEIWSFISFRNKKQSRQSWYFKRIDAKEVNNEHIMFYNKFRSIVPIFPTKLHINIQKQWNDINIFLLTTSSDVQFFLCTIFTIHSATIFLMM